MTLVSTKSTTSTSISPDVRSSSSFSTQPVACHDEALRQSLSPTPRQCTLFIAQSVVDGTWQGRPPFDKAAARRLLAREKRVAEPYCNSPRGMADAHADGQHADAPREFCPECRDQGRR